MLYPKLWLTNFAQVAGMAGKLVEYPFDTVKVRLQSQPDNAVLRYSGPLDCFRQTIAKEGFMGLYRVRHFLFSVMLRANPKQ